jgi:hypothetical protein
MLVSLFLNIKFTLLIFFLYFFFTGRAISGLFRSTVIDAITVKNNMPKRIEMDCRNSVPDDKKQEYLDHIPKASQITAFKRSIKKQNAFSYKFTTVNNIKDLIMLNWVETKQDYDKLGSIKFNIFCFVVYNCLLFYTLGNTTRFFFGLETYTVEGVDHIMFAFTCKGKTGIYLDLYAVYCYLLNSIYI